MINSRGKKIFQKTYVAIDKCCSVDETEIRGLVIAALLHDIGKFMQRAGVPHDPRYDRLTGEDYGQHGAHAKWGASFVSSCLPDPYIEDLILYHHNPARSAHPVQAKIIQDADHLSSAMDRRTRESKGKVAEEPLESIFPSISFTRERSEKTPPPERVYPLKPLSISRDAFPVSRREIDLWKLTPAYRTLWEDFASSCNHLDNPPPIGTLLALLKKYTSAIPSAVYVNRPDIPLYDHAKTTAAIAHCLAASTEEKPFLLIQGDLSGIQNFIYGIVTPEDARKRMAKRLRGRSYWLSLLMDAVAQEISREFGLFEPSVLWNTGGNFAILAPNTPTNRDSVETIARRVNQRLLERYGGRLFLAVGMLTCSRSEIESFSDTLERLSHKTGIAKTQKFIDCEISFEPRGENWPIEGCCPSCGERLEPETGRCQVCDLHEKIGQKIARARYQVRGSGLPIAFEDLGLRTSYDLTQGIPTTRGLTAALSINSTDFPIEGDLTHGFIFLGNTVPTVGDRVLSFGEMAQFARGSQRLGVIKADVDNLGRIFAFGLPEEQRTISRIHTLSTKLEFFFSGYLNSICREFLLYHDLCAGCRERATRKISVTTTDDEGIERKETYYEIERPCDECARKSLSPFYITYSGGDDLLIIGPWDAAILLAGRINDEFRRFTCNNPDITLSAGVAVATPRLPVGRAVAKADRLLERAKESGKNRIALFDECLIWDDTGYAERGYNTLITTARDIEQATSSKKISKSFVYTLLALWNQTFDDLKSCSIEEETKERIRRKRFVPYLKYVMKRHAKTRDDLESLERLVQPVFPWIRFPVYWTSLRLREERR